jgi:hypothetical protein
VLAAGAWRVLNGVIPNADLPRKRAILHEQAKRLWQRAAG